MPSSSLLPGGDKRGRSHSRTRSRSRSPMPSHPPPRPAHEESSSEEDSEDEEEGITMGNYADLPPEQRPGYVPQNGQNGPGYSNPAQPTYTPHAQWGYHAPGPPGPPVQPGVQFNADAARGGQQPPIGGIQFSQIQPGVRYTAKPVVPPRPQAPSNPFQYQQPMSPGGGQAPYPTSDQMGQQQYPPGPQSFAAAFPGMPPPPLGARSPPREKEKKRDKDKKKDKHKEKDKKKRKSPSPSPPRLSRVSSGTAYAQGAMIKEITPGGGPPKPVGLMPSGGSVLRAPSPGPGLGSRMDRLSVSGNRPDVRMIVPGGAGGLPPGSPLLEAYRGTWQSMPGMPSPMMRPLDDLDDMDDFALLEPRAPKSKRDRSRIRNERSPGPSRDRDRKKVSMYDAESDAKDIAAELSRSSPRFDILIDILPALSHDQILELRAAYKRVCKVQGIGINIAKHIKLKASGNLCKIAYVTALGRWESEGYWANFWYQSNSARRELLIESLMGRSNAEIRLIKDGFRDKRYNDSLSRCMDKELKADKFRTAVLTVLEEKKQEENDVWPIEYRNKDVDTLYDAIRRRDGGESTILNIVITRSNAHLRVVLDTFQRKYNVNFAKKALEKSNNLVGEVIAHTLNGVINRPARDAMLLHHALIDLAPAREQVKSADRKDRYELVISRLVRLHWERVHFIRVKDTYKEKYGGYLEEDIEDYVKGEDFREYCLNLCEMGGVH